MITDPSTISIVTPPITFEDWKKKHDHLECPACADIVRNCTCGYPYMELLWEDSQKMADVIVDELRKETQK